MHSAAYSVRAVYRYSESVGEPGAVYVNWWPHCVAAPHAALWVDDVCMAYLYGLYRRAQHLVFERQ